MANEVNIYVYTTVKGPKKRPGAYAYLLEAETSRGPAKLSDTGYLEAATEHQAELVALGAALKRMYKRSSLKIYTDSVHVAAGAEKWMLNIWRKNGWKNAKGETVANRQEWEELAAMLDEHRYQFIVGQKHKYYEWLKSEAGKVGKNVYSGKH
ncbi:MAG: hypothetical protein NC313_17355 [Butyrivibrio sp.]|nr:hypothetical protein [Butyrivibrio sp.]